MISRRPTGCKHVQRFSFRSCDATAFPQQLLDEVTREAIEQFHQVIRPRGSRPMAPGPCRLREVGSAEATARLEIDDRVRMVVEEERGLEAVR